jgi:DNA-binding NtrC family response regulator
LYIDKVMNRVDQTLDEMAVAAADSTARAPVLFLVLEADRPLSRGARFSLVGVETVTIGRGSERLATRSDDGRSLDVRAPGQWMSAQHAHLRAVAGDWILQDAGSRNGTFVNGQRVTSHVLRDGDIIEAGRVYFVVRGAPMELGPLVRDQDAAQSQERFGLRTLLPELQESQTALSRVARSSTVPILLLGPTGTGKEVLARDVHEGSKRPGPFIPVNCGALPSTLVESLLFGYVKGAFSGATRDELGFVRSASGGTLFLDEIGDLPATSQAALLRVLQEHEVVPLGATRAVAVDVRIVAATHRPLEALCDSGGFRNDLLARLKGYMHRLPSLFDRKADIGVMLADILLDVAGERASRLTLTPDAARALLAYGWPLNMRELHLAMASAVALATEDVIDLRHLPVEVLAPPRSQASLPPAAESSPGDVLRDRIVALLQEHRGNVTAVARAMGKAPAQIHRWMHRFQIDPDTFREL